VVPMPPLPEAMAQEEQEDDDYRPPRDRSPHRRRSPVDLNDNTFCWDKRTSENRTARKATAARADRRVATDDDAQRAANDPTTRSRYNRANRIVSRCVTSHNRRRDPARTSRTTCEHVRAHDNRACNRPHDHHHASDLRCDAPHHVAKRHANDYRRLKEIDKHDRRYRSHNNKRDRVSQASYHQTHSCRRQTSNASNTTTRRTPRHYGWLHDTIARC
jgi:hypothetical protein